MIVVIMYYTAADAVYRICLWQNVSFCMEIEPRFNYDSLRAQKAIFCKCSSAMLLAYRMIVSLI